MGTFEKFKNLDWIFNKFLIKHFKVHSMNQIDEYAFDAADAENYGT